MPYARISPKNKVMAYPVSPHQEHPFISFPDKWGGGKIGSNTSYVFVHSTPAPSIDDNYEIHEVNPVYNKAKDRWEQTYEVKPSPVPPLPDLINQVVEQATEICNVLSEEIIPNKIHQNAFHAATLLLWASEGKLPIVEHNQKLLDKYAKSLNVSENIFNTILLTYSQATIEIHSALLDLEDEVKSCHDIDELKGIVNEFQPKIDNLVNQLKEIGFTFNSPKPLSVYGVTS